MQLGQAVFLNLMSIMLCILDSQRIINDISFVKLKN